MPRLENSNLLIEVNATRRGISILRIHDVVTGREYLRGPSPLFKFAANNGTAYQSDQGVSASVQSDAGDGSGFSILAHSLDGQVGFKLHASFALDPAVALFELTAVNLTATEMFLRVVMPCIDSLQPPLHSADMMGAVPQEAGSVAPMSVEHEWGAPYQPLGKKFILDVGLPNSRNSMEVASVFDRATGGGVFFCDMDGDLNGVAPLQFTLDRSSVLGFWIGNIPAKPSHNSSMKLPRLAIGVHTDGDWHKAVDYYTLVHRPRWTFPNTPEWFREVGAIYSPMAGGAGGIYLSILPFANLAPWGAEGGRITSFDDLPLLLHEARKVGTNVLYLTDYWEGAYGEGCDHHPYANKGEYMPRLDMGGPDGLKAGIDAVHRARGRVLLYLEPFIVYRCSQVGQQLGAIWGGRDWDGKLFAIDKPADPAYPDYSDNYDMIAPLPAWQEYIAAVATNLVQQCGADGIFLDSYAWQMNRPMKDTRQSYSAQDFSNGVLQLVERVRTAVQKANPDAVVIGETTAGPIARYWDGGLNADLGFGNIWSHSSDPFSDENRNAVERFIASPVRYGIPEVRMFGNGRTLNGLHQFFAAGHGLALCNNYDGGGFIFDNADHIRRLVEIRVMYRDALMDGMQINQPRTDHLNVIAYQYQGSKSRIVTIVNIGSEDASANVSLDTADPGGRWVNLLNSREVFLTNGGVFKGVELSTGQGSLLILLNSYLPYLPGGHEFKTPY
jgi:hypothetical protein